MTSFFDDLEQRTAEQRDADLFDQLQGVLEAAVKGSPVYAERFKGIDLSLIKDRDSLATLPVLRKSELVDLQTENRPLGGLNAAPLSEFTSIFQSPGPIYEAVSEKQGTKRIERFLHAIGVGENDLVQNCFSYHFTPAGLMFDRAAKALRARVFPAGIGQTELQAKAAHDLGSSVYVGTPDYLLKICEQADEMGLSLQFTKAGVSGGALFPSLREAYQERGIACTQCYATAELGLIAYESKAKESDIVEGMIIDENIILEIVRPGTGDPVAPGEVGEVLVSLLDEAFPFIRFATGDLSCILEGVSPCGRTNQRIAGWMGRADQAAKVKGMFIRPEQIAQFLENEDGVKRAKAVITREGENDHLEVLCEADGGDEGVLAEALKGVIKLSARVSIVAPNSLPNDGLVIEDKRDYS